MIKFLKSIFIFLFFFNSSECWAQYDFMAMQKLIQEEVRKVDIESLGLDKTEKTPTQNQEKPQEVQKNIVDSITKIEEKNIQDFQNKNIIKPSLSKKSPTKKTVKKIKKKSRKKINKPIKEINDEEVEDLNKENVDSQDSLKEDGLVASQKNKIKTKKSKLRLELEKNEKITLNEKKQQEKLQKFEDLKNLYLLDLIAKEDPWDEDFDNEEKIIPKRKELAPFALEELPPLPILNRSRTNENFHIPFVYTPKEYIDIMFSAISMGSISYFNEAFKYVLNPNITNDQGDTILTYALFLKKYSVISSVLAKGADPNLPNKLGHNPVSIAIELIDFQALELLAKNKADLNYKDAFGRTYLMHASRVGFLPAVDLLIKNNVNINDMDDDGFTALSIAYRHKKELIVQYLLKNGAKTWIEKTYNPQQKSFINDLNNRWK
jgi:hypothetical protein